MSLFNPLLLPNLRWKLLASASMKRDTVGNTKVEKYKENLQLPPVLGSILFLV